MKVIIEKYNPEWKAQFEAEKKLLTKVLSNKKIKIEHIGSTAIEGLVAKPIIDIMIGLKEFDTVVEKIPKIESLNYLYVSKYENKMPYRRFFMKEINGQITHHIHMVGLGTEFWVRHLRFRDYLRSNKRERDKYNRLKRELADHEWSNGDEYADAKSDFIRNIEKKATATNTEYN